MKIKGTNRFVLFVDLIWNFYFSKFDLKISSHMIYHEVVGQYQRVQRQIKEKYFRKLCLARLFTWTNVNEI